jgi:hypothetical protein
VKPGALNICAAIVLARAPSVRQKLDLTAGWSYEKSDEGNGYANLNGWHGALSYNVLPRIALSFEGPYR